MLRRIDSQNKNPSQDKKEHKELLSSKNVVKSDIEILGVTKKNKEVEIEQKFNTFRSEIGGKRVN